MNRLLIILLALSYTSVFAYSGEGHINLGDKASELEDEGKSRDIHRPQDIQRPASAFASSSL
jgi:hypothetical protein